MDSEFLCRFQIDVIIANRSCCDITDSAFGKFLHHFPCDLGGDDIHAFTALRHSCNIFHVRRIRAGGQCKPQLLTVFFKPFSLIKIPHIKNSYAFHFNSSKSSLFSLRKRLNPLIRIRILSIVVSNSPASYIFTTTMPMGTARMIPTTLPTLYPINRRNKVGIGGIPMESPTILGWII